MKKMQEPKSNNLYKTFYGILLLIVALIIFLLSGFNRTDKVVSDGSLPNACLNQKIPHYAKSLFENIKLNGKKDEYSFIAADTFMVHTMLLSKEENSQQLHW